MFSSTYVKAIPLGLIFVLCLTAIVLGCSDQDSNSAQLGSVDIPADIKEIADLRGLTPEDIEAAVKTYHPSGMHDEYIMMSSGGN